MGNFKFVPRDWNYSGNLWLHKLSCGSIFYNILNIRERLILGQCQKPEKKFKEKIVPHNYYDIL